MKLSLPRLSVAVLCTASLTVCGAAHAQQGATTATGASRAFNPAISVNALYLGHAFLNGQLDHGDDEPEQREADEHGHGSSAEDGAELQEVEVQLSAVIDPYMSGYFTFGMHGAAGFELEEGYVVTSGLPAGLQLRLGKFLSPFGKHNQLHTHRYPFVQSPMIHLELFGEEGLNEVGVEVSALLPTTWFSELRANIANGDNEVLFASDAGSDLGYIARWTNFFDVTDDASIEVGASAATGAREGADDWSRVLGGDMTLKWKDPGPSARTLIAQGEYLHGESAGATASGGSGLLKCRFARRWWAQAGYDWASGFGEDETRTRARALLAFVPTEFSAWRLQYTASFDEHEDTAHELFLQLNITLGSHPAHAY